MKKISTRKATELYNGLFDIDVTIMDKLTLAVLEFEEELKEKVIRNYNLKLSKINKKHCSVDEQNNFFLDTQNNPIFTKFTKEAWELREVDITLLYAEEVDVEGSICTDLSRVKKLSPSILKTYNGLLFNIDMESFIQEPKTDEKN